MRSIWIAMLASSISTAAALEGCTGNVPPGGSCSRTSDCQSGLQCLYALGSGCTAEGQCGILATDCAGTSANLVLCGCDAAADLTCLPASASIATRTATGPACAADAAAPGD